MMIYLWIKWLHVVVGSLVLGITLTLGLLWAWKRSALTQQAWLVHTKQEAVIDFVRWVTARACRWWVFPMLLVQLITGTAMMHMARFAWSDAWIAGALLLLGPLVFVLERGVRCGMYGGPLRAEIPTERLPERRGIRAAQGWFATAMLLLLAIIYLMVFRPEF